jgi:hypothetical protein
MSKRNKNLNKLKKGFTAVEALVYSFILLLVLFFIVRTVITVNQTHRQVNLTQEVESSATLAMERILREARNATSITIAQSTLGSSPGRLTLAGTDQTGVDYTIAFYLSEGRVWIAKNTEPPGALTKQGLTVTSLIFRRLVNSESEAVRAELSISGASGGVTKALDLQGSAVLRNSYK